MSRASSPQPLNPAAGVKRARTFREALLAIPEHERHAPGCPVRQQAYYRMRLEWRPIDYVERPCECGVAELLQPPTPGSYRV